MMRHLQMGEAHEPMLPRAADETRPSLLPITQPNRPPKPEESPPDEPPRPEPLKILSSFVYFRRLHFAIPLAVIACEMVQYAESYIVNPGWFYDAAPLVLGAFILNISTMLLLCALRAGAASSKARSLERAFSAVAIASIYLEYILIRSAMYLTDPSGMRPPSPPPPPPPPPLTPAIDPDVHYFTQWQNEVTRSIQSFLQCAGRGGHPLSWIRQPGSAASWRTTS